MTTSEGLLKLYLGLDLTDPRSSFSLKTNQFYIYIKLIFYRKSLGEEIEEMDTDEEKLEKIALLLGVEKVSQKDIEQFMKNIKHVKPRKSEGYGFGKLSGYVHD